MELSQVRLIVSDFAGCFRFYRDVLGLKPQFDDDRGPYAKFSPDEGSAGIALHDRADLERSLPGLAAAAGDRALVVLHVDDVDRYAAEITARGATLLSEPTVMWERIRVAYLRDPEGNLIELQQWLAPRNA
jgi:catechol 2,3-dioxygenase-like lactoylglutathione lyase family enzyme